MEDDQQFCLRWNNHQSTLIQNFDTLLESGTLVDCTLAAEGKYLKAHKVVLSACSPYFEGLLSEHYDKHPVFILKDVKFKELKAMMDYMYRGEVNISQDQLAALLKAAESLQIKGLSESKTSGSSKTDSRQQKVVPQTSQPDIPISSSGLTIEKNKVPRQGVSQGPLGDLPEDSASPQIPKGLSSREGSQSPTSRKRKRFRRKSIGDDNSVENHEASNSSDMPQQMSVPALGIAPVADEKSHADPTDSIGRSALMTQLTKPADEMLQLPLEKPEPSDNLIEPKSEYLEDPEESVEDLTLDDDMNDLNEMEQDNNRAGPSHDPSQHPAGIGAWHVTGDRSNAGGVVGSVAGAPGTTDEVFLAAQEAAQAHRDSQELFADSICGDDSKRKYNCKYCGKGFTFSGHLRSHQKSFCYWNPRSTCHQLQKSRPFSCGQCGACYAKQSHLIFHVRHDCGRTQKCPVCGKTFLHSSSLRKHRQRPPCNFQTRCVKKRTITSSLTRRKEQQASGIIEKSERNDSWGSEDDLMQINLNEWGDDGDSSTSNGRERNDGNNGNENTSKRNETAPYNKENNRNRNDENCEGDSGSSGSITDLSTNERWMQPLNQLSSIPINCRYCEKTFIRPANLARHEKNNCLKNKIAKCHTERNANPFVCMECGARFKHKKALNYHVRHMCQRSVKCNICHKNLIGTVVSARHLRMCAQKHAKKIECVNDNEDQEDLLNSDSFVISEISDND